MDDLRRKLHGVAAQLVISIVGTAAVYLGVQTGSEAVMIMGAALAALVPFQIGFNRVGRGELKPGRYVDRDNGRIWSRRYAISDETKAYSAEVLAALKDWEAQPDWHPDKVTLVEDLRLRLDELDPEWRVRDGRMNPPPPAMQPPGTVSPFQPVPKLIGLDDVIADVKADPGQLLVTFKTGRRAVYHFHSEDDRQVALKNFRDAVNSERLEMHSARMVKVLAHPGPMMGRGTPEEARFLRPPEPPEVDPSLLQRISE